ncbi:MAG: PAS domain-containing protein, partial [Candidatus Pacebacteria bacterium]|nr:PAS domain-containing protein [Candidatus Paceibacterota bacterium]
IAELAGNYGVTWVSEQIHPLSGFSVEQFIRDSNIWASRLHPEDRERVLEEVGELPEKGEIEIEYRWQRADGKYLWLLDHAVLIRGKRGESSRIIGTWLDITERKMAAEVIQNFFNLSPDLLCISDLGSNYFKKINPAFEKTLGYSTEELLSKPFPDFLHPRDNTKTIHSMKRQKRSDMDRTFHFENRYISKDGSLKWLAWRYYHNPEDGLAYGVGRDITERKKAETEMKKRLMRYNVEEGNIYLVKEPSPSQSLEALRDLLDIGYDGTVFSRIPETVFRKSFEGDFNFAWLAESGEKNALPPDLEILRQRLENRPQKETILIDRLDYLVFKNGFEKTLSFIQNLRETSYLNDFTVIMSVDPGTFGEQELMMIEKECKELEPLHKSLLSEKLFSILKLAYKQSEMNLVTTYKNIGQDLDLSRPTVMKRMGSLVYLGYLSEKRKGKVKTFELTDKAKNVFSK